MTLSATVLLEKAKALLSSLSSKKPLPAAPSSRKVGLPSTTTARRVGLNIGRFSLVACEVSLKGQKFTLERVGRMSLLPEEPIAEQIKKFWKESGFESKRVNISIKGKGVVIRFLNFPRMNPEEFASSIQYEAEKYLPFSLNEINFDHHILESSDQKSPESTTMPVILVAARKAEIEKVMETLKAADLQIHAIDVDTFACVNAFQFAVPDAKTRVVGLVDFGARDTTVSILDKGILTFSRDIAFGGSDFTELIGRKFNLDRAAALKKQDESESASPEEHAAIDEILDRLFQEIKTSIQYYYNQKENQSPLETIFISGGFSKFKILPKLFEKQIQIPVAFWDPTQEMDKSPLVDPGMLSELAPFLPVSIGLAIRPK